MPFSEAGPVSDSQLITLTGLRQLCIGLHFAAGSLASSTRGLAPNPNPTCDMLGLPWFPLFQL